MKRNVEIYKKIKKEGLRMLYGIIGAGITAAMYELYIKVKKKKVEQYKMEKISHSRKWFREYCRTVL